MLAINDVAGTILPTGHQGREATARRIFRGDTPKTRRSQNPRQGR